ncbi:hypothetical protein Q3G72_027173 [Acer saccharum]|nr:hypothetical protein Q3G72_027173 [Acer saccharum]
MSSNCHESHAALFYHSRMHSQPSLNTSGELLHPPTNHGISKDVADVQGLNGSIKADQKPIERPAVGHPIATNGGSPDGHKLIV